MRRVVLFALLAGCGDDLAPTRCEPDGFADGETVIANAPLGPFARAAVVATASPLGTTSALVFDETAGSCGELTPTGRHLALLFCDPPTERTYIVVAAPRFHCPGDNVLALVEDPGGVDVATGTAGTIVFDTVAGCARGTYALEFGLDLIEGGFDAIVCP